MVLLRVITTTTTQESRDMTKLNYFAFAFSLACAADVEMIARPVWAIVSGTDCGLTKDDCRKNERSFLTGP